MNRLSVRGKNEKITRIGKGNGEFFTLSPNREPVHRLTKSMERWHRKYVSTLSPTQTTARLSSLADFFLLFPVRSLDPGYDSSGRRSASNLRISGILMTVKKGCGPRSFSGKRKKDDIDV